MVTKKLAPIHPGEVLERDKLGNRLRKEVSVMARAS